MLAPQVGDQSDFVTGFSRVLAETAPRIGPALSPLHFRYFCDKLAVSFCPRFYEYIFRCACLAKLAASSGCVHAHARPQCGGACSVILQLSGGLLCWRYCQEQRVTKVWRAGCQARLLPAVGDGGVSKAWGVQVPEGKRGWEPAAASRHAGHQGTPPGLPLSRCAAGLL